MCGIVGIINSKDKKTIEKMAKAISHRGPDEEGYFVDGHVSLGMRRLSIIDLAHGKQPIFSDDGRYMIFFNGEIYNYKELRKELKDKGVRFHSESDTEVILRMFEHHGIESVRNLRGMFAFCIYDREHGKIYLARDHFGIKPLYYFKHDEKIKAFASEVKGFLALPEFDPAVNDAAVFNYLSFQYNPLEESFFKHVYKLPPASYMVLDLKSSHYDIKKYWKFEFKADNNLDEEKTRKEILKVMHDSVTHHMIADVPVGSFLSGGIDSSIIATLMQRVRGQNKIKTFTVGFQSLSEGVQAKETSEPLGTDHKEITVTPDEYFKSLPKVVWHFDEPVADPSAVGLYFLAREAAKHVKVVLSGEGSDELFGGYNIYLEPYARKFLSFIPMKFLLFLKDLPFNFKGKSFANRMLTKLEDRYIGNASIFSNNEITKLWKGKHEEKFSLKEIYDKTGDLSDSTKMQYVDINTWLVGDILAKADKMSMAHSLEVRVPFLDVEVAKLASTLPDHFKWRNYSTKYLLRQAFKDVLPRSVRKRKKLGFPTPVRNWFTPDRTALYRLITENDYIKTHLDVAMIQKLIKDHTFKKADNSRKIYLLLMLALWYNTFIKQD